MWYNKITIIDIISRIIIIISNAGISNFTIIERYGVVSSIVAVDSNSLIACCMHFVMMMILVALLV